MCGEGLRDILSWLGLRDMLLLQKSKLVFISKVNALAQVAYALAPYFRKATNGRLPNLKLQDALKFKFKAGECVNRLLRLSLRCLSVSKESRNESLVT